MQQNSCDALNPLEKIASAERATGQKNYVHARLRAEKVQLNARLAGTAATAQKPSGASLEGCRVPTK